MDQCHPEVHLHIINSWGHRVLLTLDPTVRHPACILPCLLTVLWVLMVHPMDLLMDPWVLTVLHLSWTEWIQGKLTFKIDFLLRKFKKNLFSRFRPTRRPLPMPQPDYRIHEMNKRLQQRTDDSDNLWWDAFATEFFEDDANLTLTFCLEDGPKRFSKFNQL